TFAMPAFYFPWDEFHAFQTGIPLSRLLTSLSNGGDRIIDVVAHSLGNLVVNSAIAYGDDMNNVVRRYVMNQAAVPAEAFAFDYQDDARMAAKAADQGYGGHPPFGPADQRWIDEWQEMNDDYCGYADCGGCEVVLAMDPVPLPLG